MAWDWALDTSSEQALLPHHQISHDTVSPLAAFARRLQIFRVVHK